MTNKVGPVDQSMIAKIDNKVDDAGSASRISPSKGAADAAPGTAATARDTVELTSRAQLLERLEKSLESVPAVDSRRVAEVRAAIEDGNYEIDAEAIADAMIRFERALGD